MKYVHTLFFSLLITISMPFISAGSSYAQQIQYPIAELGNCRDAQECFYYCKIPRNTPACWSYGTYILHKNVLGMTTKSPDDIAKEHGITFPIPELGNCNSPQACMQYCNIPANQQACSDFGRKKGLIQDNGNIQQSAEENKTLLDAKTQLGCTSKESCIAFCNDPSNQQKCQQFAQSEGLAQQLPQPTIPPTIFSTAKQELGCDSKEMCMYYCSMPDHYQKCQQFAREHNLVHPQIQQIYPTSVPTGQFHQSPFPVISGMTPPCTDQTSCMQWCKGNPQQCQSFKQQYYQNQYNGTNNIPSQSVSIYPSSSFQPNSHYQENFQPPATSSASAGCTTTQDCYQHCQQDPTQCPGFQQNNQIPPSQPFPSTYQQSPTGYMQQLPPQQFQPTVIHTQQPQSNNNQPPPNIPNTTTDQQKMCSQTPGCAWTGSTCNCQSTH